MPRVSKKGLGRTESRAYRFRVPNDLMDEWEKYVSEHGEEAAESLRDVMRHLVKRPRRSAEPAVKPFVVGAARAAANEVDRDPKKPMKFYFTRSEHEALSQIADERECSIQFWVLSLVRAALTKGVTVGGAELKALGESNYQLMAIGRNLNQITHQINADPTRHLYRVTAKSIERLLEIVESHRKEVHALVSACTHRWRITEKQNGG